MDAMNNPRYTVYDAPGARIDDAVADPGSLLRGFAGGWVALLLGIGLAVGWRVLQINGSLPPAPGIGTVAWIALFAPVFWIGVHHHRGGQRRSASGALIALVSFFAVIVGIIVLGMIQA
jgi:hypothetical protein